MSTGFVVLGHGSKVPETVEILKEITCSLEKRLLEGKVRYAALQFNEPGIPEAIAALAGDGVTEIVVLPLFLVDGNHVREDIPGIISEEGLKYPSIKIKLADHIGADMRITDILVDRIASIIDKDIKQNGKRPEVPMLIEEESFRIIEASLDLMQVNAVDRAVIKRIVHACGDLSVANAIDISEGAVEAGVRAIKNGCSIVTDVRMVATGISDRLTEVYGNTIVCKVDDRQVEEEAKRLGRTRSAVGIRMLADHIAGGIVAVGNAPTALFELLDMINEGCDKPTLVIGTPVGFVGATESKEMLKNSGLSYITVNGTRGGSAMAVAAANAILRMTCDGSEK